MVRTRRGEAGKRKAEKCDTALALLPVVRNQERARRSTADASKKGWQADVGVGERIGDAQELRLFGR